MRVKRYVVNEIPEALQQIRSELGANAVILNTKQIRSGGFLGLFAKTRFEVIAAADEPAAPGSPPARSADPVPSAARSDVKTGAASSVRTTPADMPISLQDTMPPTIGKTVERSPEPVAVPTIKQPESSDDDVILKELRLMRRMVEQLSAFSTTMSLSDPTMDKLKERLSEQQLQPDLIRQITEELGERARTLGDRWNEREAWACAKNALRQVLESSVISPLSEHTRIAQFVGPTGVGKTTTIAKLAAEQALKYRRKVGFITSDTYRIAAVDQLKTYATILNAPLEVVSSPLDLTKAMDRLAHCDIILMDTAGRNYRNQMHVSELNAFLQMAEPSETYLVLSMTMKYADMRAIVDNFAKYKLDKVLFTKLDETDSYGPIFNLLREFPFKLSYVTDGQNVPDDLSVLDPGVIVDKLMGEPVHD